MDLLGALSGFINLYFVDPLAFQDKYPPYNIFNTAAFAILALIAAYFIFKGLRKHNIKIDSSFYWAIVPFIFLGSTARVLDDAGVLPRSVNFAGFTLYPFVTPVLYVVIFLVAVLAIAIALQASIKTRVKFTTALQGIGLVLLAASIIPLLFIFKNFVSIAMILPLSFVGVVAYFAVCRALDRKWSSIELMAVWGQSLDGAATFIGVSYYGYFEQHVLGNAIFALFGTPFAFFILKIAFSILVVTLAQRELGEAEDDELRTFVFLLVTIFGLAPGTRDTLRLLAGV